MAEAEDVVVDVARHATVYAQKLWRQHRGPIEVAPTLALNDIAPRLDLLITSVFGSSYTIKIAQAPARPTFLAKLLRHQQPPFITQKIPATDGKNIWLPPDSGLTDFGQAREIYRVMALQQVMRAERGSALSINQINNSLLADVYLLLEAYAADAALAKLLPGLNNGINTLRAFAVIQRPALVRFSKPRQPLENFLRLLLGSKSGETSNQIPLTDSPAQSLVEAQQIIATLKLDALGNSRRILSTTPLLKDWWTGELRMPPNHEHAPDLPSANSGEDSADDKPVRASRLERRPEVRNALADEDDTEKDPGIFMVQADEPHHHAEDPFGLQRPTDKDDTTGADEYGDLVSELAQARLVATPGRAKEILLSDDPPDAKARRELQEAIQEGRGLNYPEWDYRAANYQHPGAIVRLLSSASGSQQWVDQTLSEHRSLLASIKRHFEMLRARRITHRKLLDGDEIDLEAYIESYADFRAGSAMSEAVYQTRRAAERSLAITLLIDISGSTDGWISAHRRVIDVEKEALLLVCIALEGLGEPYSVLAFSGEGQHAVTLREIKSFDEHYSNNIALKISALEPERYTRTGAALRHASAQLMHLNAAHRLLVLLSDGKPNDNDNYEGRYGVEDTKKAVMEAKLQGIFPFCLTIDRQGANYLPHIFGNNQYALLPKPDQLPRVLLEWIKRLVAA
jgi:nitric oxide reductase NorD protein